MRSSPRNYQSGNTAFIVVASAKCGLLRSMALFAAEYFEFPKELPIFLWHDKMGNFYANISLRTVNRDSSSKPART
jgi:hypothetical protein